MNQNLGGNAEIHGVGLFLAIAALFVAGVAGGMAFMVFLSGRDQVANLKDDVIKLEGSVDQLKIQFDDLKAK